MSPSELARQRLARLAATLHRDLEALDSHAVVARTLHDSWVSRRDDPAQRAWAATSLHAWYTGLETAVERLLRALDGEVPTGPASHRALLDQATLGLEGIRPPLIPSSVLPGLEHLLAFRHFFRDAYAVELDAGRLEENLGRLLAVHQPVRAHLDGVVQFLSRAADERG